MALALDRLGRSLLNLLDTPGEPEAGDRHTAAPRAFFQVTVPCDLIQGQRGWRPRAHAALVVLDGVPLE
jgi:hypothetical protein